MAGASLNDIKSRIKSVSGTMQITKAMELVATSKLRRARERVENSRPFYEILGEAIDGITSSDTENTPWVKESKGEKPLFIVIAGDRGLAGGYNANVFRLTAKLAEDKEASYIPIGKKAVDYFRHRGIKVESADYSPVSEITVSGALAVSRLVCQKFISGECDSVYVIYTRFVSMITQTPVYEQLLPLDRDENKSYSPDPIWGGEPEEILDKIVPDYVGGVIYSTVCEALASESGARRSAMNAANKNASEMIDTLMLRYNRARQAVITQEITEIVSGSEAL